MVRLDNISSSILWIFILVLFCIDFSTLKAQNNIIYLYPDSAEYEISKHIYGHFSEHPGRCIYGGIWVGEDPGNKYFSFKK